MTDATNAAVPVPDADPTVQAKGGSSFLSTGRGRIVAIGAVVALLFIAGVAAAVLYLFGDSLLTGGEGANLKSVRKPAASATTTAAVSVPIENPPERPLSSSFTFRNVFAPTVMPPAAETSEAPEPTTAPATPASSGGSTTESTTVKPTSTLTLTEIVTEGDAHKGVFTLDGTTYTAGNGETLGSSPWKVIEVGTDSVLMLYGDSQVTISIGQGITK